MFRRPSSGILVVVALIAIGAAFRVPHVLALAGSNGTGVKDSPKAQISRAANAIAPVLAGGTATPQPAATVARTTPQSAASAATTTPRPAVTATATAQPAQSDAEGKIDGAVSAVIPVLQAGGTVVTPGPVVTATPRPTTAPVSSGVVITSLRTVDDGHLSPTLYTRHDLRFMLGYRSYGRIPFARVTFSIVDRGATIAVVRRQVSGAAGYVSVHIPGGLAPGRKLLIGTLSYGRVQHTETRTFTVLDPTSFLHGRDLQHAAQVTKVRLARVESNAQADREKYVVHLGRQSFAQQGRQTGVFRVVKLAWPHIDSSQVAVQAALVSMYGTQDQARAAYRTQVQQYDSRQTCRSSCSLRIRTAKVDARVGEYRSAFSIGSRAGLHIREALFVRGQIMVQVWSYYVGSLPARLSHALDRAALGTMGSFDSLARQQQQ